ncbi:MAG: heme-copper oxidase subunit III [Phycisphaeraceae bacterium]|nr:heme-copper oxidase subunit III [Phycisphaeraceae bacterium]
MSQATLNPAAHSHALGGQSHEPVLMAHGSVLKTGIHNGKIALWLFLASEVMFFTGLIGAYIVLRGGQNFSNWPDPTKALNVPLTAANTFLLICSSVTLVWGLQGYQADKIKQGNWGMILTTLFGALFVGVQGFEYYELWHAGVRPDANLFGSCFYAMTGFHGLHVLLGVVALVVLSLMGLCGKFHAKNYAAVELTGLYWHFVDLVWIILFAIVYLM